MSAVPVGLTFGAAVHEACGTVRERLAIDCFLMPLRPHDGVQQHSSEP